ncbi:tumor protein p63-regulated gene 1 protein [Bombina bombina]|uniref:tumor protein p63-regulated gene 1 protein n=1 Tax=Bombina bombina TaxID=8345 RepID=UPI00235B16B4|nr:tumor protein p63-regulated gene 1 protein [Bombina bombina]
MDNVSHSQEFRPVELGGDADQQVKLDTENKPAQSESNQTQNVDSNSSNIQYLLRKFFVARPGAFDQAAEDLKAQVLMKENETVESIWLLAEVDHWNNEKERVVLITDKSLYICKYDFIMLCSQQIQKVPLNFIDRICLGPFTFPPKSLDKREGNGLRIHWDKLREASFASRWNPLSIDMPYTTFIEHPLKNCTEKFSAICQLTGFMDCLEKAVQEAHKANPVPGRANGVVILNQPIAIETYVGFMSFIGNRNKLGYSLARGSVGF